MNGKNKCKILKEIRKQIAEQNDIAFVTSECKHQGSCTGTCPKCEAEVRYLEEQLSCRRKAGKAVAVAGVAVTLLAAGCEAAEIPDPVTDTQPPDSGYELVLGEVTDPIELELMGIVERETEPLLGEVPVPSE